MNFFLLRKQERAQTVSSEVSSFFLINKKSINQYPTNEVHTSEEIRPKKL